MSKTTTTGAAKAFANQFLSFINASPTHFHSVEVCSKMLDKAGFTKLKESQASDFAEGSLKKGGKYYFTRNQSSIVAFAVGENFNGESSGFTVMGAHTDSPVPKLKPKSKVSKGGCEQIGVELYGGGLWNTWFDRDLSVAGRVIVKGENGKYTSKLVDLKKPLLRIPNLAIHLNRGIYEKGFQYNKEEQVLPVFATSLKAKMEEGSESKDNTDHHPLLLQTVAKELSTPISDICDFELCLYDTQPANLGGLLDEFVCSRALDNLMMSFVTLSALIDSTQDSKSLSEEKNVRVVVLFDNEEVGSTSEHGADSDMFPSILKRIHKSLAGGDMNLFHAAMRKSLLISADMAHALHPNYQSKHEGNHAPLMHEGLVIKQNANQRYATTTVTTLFLSEIAKKHNIPLQKFVVRNDSACGSTIGPALSAGCGIRTIDVGIAQWAMHSIRETCGVDDVLSSYELFKHVFAEFPDLEKNVDLEE